MTNTQLEQLQLKVLANLNESLKNQKSDTSEKESLNKDSDYKLKDPVN